MNNEPENISARNPVAYVVTPKDPRCSPFLVFAPSVFESDGFREDFLIEPLYGDVPPNARNQADKPR